MDLYEISLGVLHFALFALVGYLALQWTRIHRETLPFQSRLFLYAFSIRFAVSLLIYQGGLIDTIKDEDGSGTWIAGDYLREGWEREGHSVLEAPLFFLRAYEASNQGYYYLLGLLFMVTGLPGRLPAAALNCLLGALTIVFVYRVARTLFAEAVARRAAWLACFFPSLIIWSAQTLKEPVVIFLETLALYGCLSLRKSGFSLRHICLLSLAALLVHPFRFYATYLVAGAVLTALVLPRRARGKTSFGAAAAVVLLIAGFVALSGVQLTKELERQRFDLEYIKLLKDGGTIGQSSGVKTDADLSTPAGFGFALLIGALHLLLAPFPWQWGTSLRMALVIPETVFWWGLLIYGVAPGLWHCVRHRFFDVLPLLLFILGMGLLYSLLFGNIGLIYRQRAQLLPWLLIFAAVGIVLRRSARRPTRLPPIAAQNVRAPSPPQEVASCTPS